jgi:serine O-acetyltransferase
LLKFPHCGIIGGAEIPPNGIVDGGMLIPHVNRIMIRPGAKIGVNCLTFQQVTIRARNGRSEPVIEDHVNVVGAKILGPVFIGAHPKIGTNAVAVSDVLSGAVAASIPTKIISQHGIDPIWVDPEPTKAA